MLLGWHSDMMWAGLGLGRTHCRLVAGEENCLMMMKKNYSVMIGKNWLVMMKKNRLVGENWVVIIGRGQKHLGVV